MTTHNFSAYQLPDNDEHLIAYYGLPTRVQFCKRCVISNQRPSSVIEFKNQPSHRKPTIEFDDEGVCSACRYAERKDHGIDWEARRRQLEELCDKYRSRTGAYDCIVPGSGGKDSAYTSHILKTRFGMNPLTVTWAPHWYTDIGWRNFQSWIHSGFDNVLVTPNGAVHRLLTKLAFLNLCHPFQPFIIGQRLVGPRMAGLMKVPLIFYGENQAEYGNNVDDNDRPTMDLSFFMQEPNLDELFIGGAAARDIIKNDGLHASDFNLYLPVEPKLLKDIDAQVHYLGYYLKWDPQENYYYAIENTGFESNPERTEGSYSKYSSIDDRIDPLHYYTTFIKFGIGRATYDAAQEIRNHKITREEGVALVRRYDAEFPRKYYYDFLKYIDIDESTFQKVIDDARSPHLWMRKESEWLLRHVVS